MKFLFSTYLFLIVSIAMSQNVTTTFKSGLPTLLEETSGLIYFNGKIITHNDSGGDPKLYEIDTITGNITRTIEITNAINIDWEDIAQDSNYIYIGDIGNNNGNRTNLKIYRILKSDYLNNLTVLADTINFSYNDQVNFTSLPNNNNFDCEAFVIHNDSIILFTKNWVTATVNAYVLPKTIGSHIAKNVSTYNSLGLITGADNINNTFYLSGYNNSIIPFILIVNSNGVNQDFFGSSIISKHVLNLN
ncbi:MAG: T9SS C-terminal target domain-containing protein, partial [Flavobacteriales bacterium]|nr:T9SS C-terminal target domain-containing protein [Flavobacteriales bacterium]